MSSEPSSKPLPTAMDHRVSDGAAANTFGPISLGGVQMCPLQSIPGKPCDIEEIVLSEIRKSKEKPAGSTFEERQSDKPRGLRLLRTRSAGPKNPENLFQVIAYPKGKAPETQVDVELTPFGTPDEPHVALSIAGPDGDGDRTIRTTTKRKETVAVHSRTPAGRLSGFLEKFWTYSIPPNIYTIRATSCGFRDEGPVVGDVELQVEAFCGDHVKVELDIPRVVLENVADALLGKSEIAVKKSMSGNRMIPLERGDNSLLRFGAPLSERSDSRIEDGATITETTGFDGKTSKEVHTKESIRNGVRQVELAETKFKDGRAVYASAEQTDTTAGYHRLPSLKVFVNNQEFSTSDLNRLLQAIHLFRKKIQSLRELLLPKLNIGAYWKWDMSFLSGSLRAGWGYEESTDHRVHFGVTVQPALTVMQGSALFGFGLETERGTVSVNCGIAEMSLELTRMLHWGRPEDPEIAQSSAVIDIPIVVRGTMAADIYVVNFAAQAGARSGLNGELALRAGAEGLALSLEMAMAKCVVQAVFRSNVGLAWESEPWELWDEQPIYNGRLF